MMILSFLIIKHEEKIKKDESVPVYETARITFEVLILQVL